MPDKSEGAFIVPGLPATKEHRWVRTWYLVNRQVTAREECEFCGAIRPPRNDDGECPGKRERPDV